MTNRSGVPLKAVEDVVLLKPTPDLVPPALDVANKGELFQRLAEALFDHGSALHREAIRHAKSAREALGSSGVGHGIALPHLRSMVMTSTTLVFARLVSALDFGSPDGEPVSVVLLIASPYGLKGALLGPLVAAATSAARSPGDRRALVAIDSAPTFERFIGDALRPRILEMLSR
jgi:mannitol/fructose-specific phosphotransferase system IIA component (Ntr-type)